MKRKKYQIRVNGEWYTGIASKSSQIILCRKEGGEEEAVEDIEELLVPGAAASFVIEVKEGFVPKHVEYLGKISGVRHTKFDTSEVLLSMCDYQIEAHLPVEDIVAVQLYAPAEGLVWRKGKE